MSAVLLALTTSTDLPCRYILSAFELDKIIIRITIPSTKTKSHMDLSNARASLWFLHYYPPLKPPKFSLYKVLAKRQLSATPICRTNKSRSVTWGSVSLHPHNPYHWRQHVFLGSLHSRQMQTCLTTYRRDDTPTHPISENSSFAPTKSTFVPDKSSFARQQPTRRHPTPTPISENSSASGCSRNFELFAFFVFSLKKFWARAPRPPTSYAYD